MMYLLLANLYLCVFYGFYHVFLRRETFFQWNRIYLLAGLLLAFTLPLVEHGEFDNTVVYQYHLPVIQLGDSAPEQLATGATTAKSPTLIRKYVSIGYVVGCIIAAIFVAMQVVYTVRALRKRHPGQACSFFGIIRIDHTIYGSHKIAHHERVHVRQWHSADIVVMQVVKILNWFNPLVYLYERALKLQHEYIADGKTAANDQMAYAELLVSRAMGLNGPALANSFSNKTLLKRRITMLLRDKSSRYSWLRYMILLPVIVGMVVFSIACNNQQRAGTTETTSGDTTATSSDATKAFMKELGSWTVYSDQALRSGTRGVLAVTFEKSEAGQIENIQFLNELGGGQEAEVIRALRRENVAHLAPTGKNMVSINFQISGAEPSDMPPPPPVSNEYNGLGEVVIVGYRPEPPPPPPVEPTSKNRAADDNAATKAEKKYPEPTVVEVKVADNKPELTEEEKNQLFQTVEINPQPPGGMQAFMKYIGANYDYPQEAIDAGVNGQVQVAFVVEKDGSLTDLKIIRDLGYGTGEAAVRVLQSSSKWSPGIQNGRKVRVEYTLPIRLNLQQ